LGVGGSQGCERVKIEQIGGDEEESNQALAAKLAKTPGADE
jgi:hypothetical protein